MRSNFVFQEIWVGLRRNLTMTVALIVVVAISLSLLGTGLLFVKQVDRTRSYWQSKVEISAYPWYGRDATLPRRGDRGPDAGAAAAAAGHAAGAERHLREPGGGLGAVQAGVRQRS